MAREDTRFALRVQPRAAGRRAGGTDRYWKEASSCSRARSLVSLAASKSASPDEGACFFALAATLVAGEGPVQGATSRPAGRSTRPRPLSGGASVCPYPWPPSPSQRHPLGPALAVPRVLRRRRFLPRHVIRVERLLDPWLPCLSDGFAAAIGTAGGAIATGTTGESTLGAAAAAATVVGGGPLDGDAVHDRLSKGRTTEPPHTMPSVKIIPSAPRPKARTNIKLAATRRHLGGHARKRRRRRHRIPDEDRRVRRLGREIGGTRHAAMEHRRGRGGGRAARNRHRVGRDRRGSGARDGNGNRSRRASRRRSNRGRLRGDRARRGGSPDAEEPRGATERVRCGAEAPVATGDRLTEARSLFDLADAAAIRWSMDPLFDDYGGRRRAPHRIALRPVRSLRGLTVGTLRALRIETVAPRHHRRAVVVHRLHRRPYHSAN